MSNNQAKNNLPPQLRSVDAQKKFATDVLLVHKSGTEQRDKLLDRWDIQENYYKGIEVPAEKTPWPGAADYNFPVVAPKLRQRRSQIFAAASQSEPMFRVKRVGNEKATTAAEVLLEHNLIVSNFRERFLAPALDLVMPTNLAIAYVTVSHLPNGNPASAHIGPFAGVVADLVHPRNFAVYPEAAKSLEQSKLHGHTYELRKAQIVELYTKGVFITNLEDVTSPDLPARTSEDASATGTSKPSTLSHDDPTLQIFHGFYRCDLDKDGIEEAYRVNIHVKSQTLLSCSKWTEAMSLYAVLFVKEEIGRVFTEGSPFKDAQGVQLSFDALLNQFLQNNAMAARPAVLTEGWTPDESAAAYEPGQVMPQTQLGAAMPIPSSVDNSATVPLMNLMQSIADKATNVSDALTGGRANSRESTATEENIKAQAFQISSVDDMVRLSVGLNRIAQIMLMLLKKHVDLVTRTYSDLMFEGRPITAEDMEAIYQISLASKHVLDSPEQHSNATKNLFALLSPLADRVDPEVFTILLAAIVEYSSVPDDLKHRLKQRIAPSMVEATPPPGQIPGVGELEAVAGMAGIPGAPPGVGGGSLEDLASLLGPGAAGGDPNPGAVA